MKTARNVPILYFFSTLAKMSRNLGGFWFATQKFIKFRLKNPNEISCWNNIKDEYEDKQRISAISWVISQNSHSQICIEGQVQTNYFYN